MRRGALLLAILLPLAGLAGDAAAMAQALDVKLLPRESPIEGIVVGLTASLVAAGVSCDQSTLTLQGPGLTQPVKLELKDCVIKDGKLTATASIPGSQIGEEKLEAVLLACGDDKSHCETRRTFLFGSAAPLAPLPLTLQAVETAHGVLVFQARNLPSEFGPAHAVRVVAWQPAAGKPVDLPPAATADASQLTLTIPLGCSSLDLSGTKFTQAVFQVRDSKGSPFLLSFKGALPLCGGQPPPWYSSERFWLTAGGICLALLSLLGGIQLGKRRRVEPNDPVTVDLLSWLKESIQGLPVKLEKGFGELNARIDALKPLRASSTVSAFTVEDEPEESGQPFAAGPEVTGHEKELLQTVNNWWERGGGDKDQLIGSLSQGGSKLYVSFDIDATLQRLVGQTFSFRPSDGPAGWAWYPLSRGEALAVPADPFLFHAGNMIEVLRLLFDGIGDSPKSFRFYRVHKACRLRSNSHGSEIYQLVEKGVLELADRSGTRIPGPQLSTGRVSSATVPLRKNTPKTSLELVGTPGPSLHEIGDRLRLVLKEEAARLQPVQIPPPVDTSREAMEVVRNQFDHLSADLRKLDRIQDSLTDLALRIQSLKQAPPAASVKALAPSERRMAPDAFPPPSPPVPRVEPTLPVVTLPPPPTRVAAEPAPGEFLLRLNQAMPMLATAASEAPESLVPSDYLRRLTQMLQNLPRARTDQGWKVSLVHLQVVRVSEKDKVFSVHPVEICEDFREARCRCGELPEALLVQIFLSIQYGEEDLMAIAMAANNLAERFAEGYSLLTGDEDVRGRGSVLMKRPSVLQRTKGSSESWRVILPMEVLP